jgi:hypothetical protein
VELGLPLEEVLGAVVWPFELVVGDATAAAAVFTQEQTARAEDET